MAGDHFLNYEYVINSHFATNHSNQVDFESSVLGYKRKDSYSSRLALGLVDSNFDSES